jgi:hypothetical protein
MREEKITQNLLFMLQYFSDSWNFKKCIDIYNILAVQDYHYYAEFLIWLTDHGFLEEVDHIINKKSVIFLKKLKKDESIEESLRKGLHSVLAYYEKVFLPAGRGEFAENLHDSEKIILQCYFSNNMQELQKYIETNGETLFGKKYRQEHAKNVGKPMVNIFALRMLHQNGLLSLNIAKMAVQAECSPRRCRCIIDMVASHLLFSPRFTNIKALVNPDFIFILHKLFLGGGKYGHVLLKHFYGMIGNCVELIAPLTDNEPKYYEVKHYGKRNDNLISSKVKALTTLLSSKVKTLTTLPFPHVAVCISGMTRGDGEALKSIAKNIIAPLHADVFLSTWDTHQLWPGLGNHYEGFDIIQRFFPPAVEYMPSELCYGTSFLDTFPHVYKKMNLEKSILLDIHFYTKNFPLTHYLVENEKYFLSSLPFEADKLKNGESYNQAKMFYKIYSATKLALEHETTTGKRYDYIIRCRPDMLCHGSIQPQDLEAVRPGEIALNYTRFGPNDYFWVGRRAEMISLSSIWKQMFATQSFNIFRDVKWRSHRLLALYIGKRNLSTRDGLVKMKLLPPSSVTFDIKEELERDLSGPAAKYKNNEQIKKLFTCMLSNHTM